MSVIHPVLADCASHRAARSKCSRLPTRSSLCRCLGVSPLSSFLPLPRACSASSSPRSRAISVFFSPLARALFLSLPARARSLSFSPSLAQSVSSSFLSLSLFPPSLFLSFSVSLFLSSCLSLFQRGPLFLSEALYPPPTRPSLSNAQLFCRRKGTCSRPRLLVLPLVRESKLAPPTPPLSLPPSPLSLSPTPSPCEGFDFDSYASHHNDLCRGY